MELQSACSVAGRSAAALTRRDIALALLGEPATEALAGLPKLRRDMVAAGNPLSAAFWESATDTLASIQRGSATVGAVRSWQASTGTEPVDLPELYHFWPESGETRPVATELRGRLVTHLESLVANGTIDPDLLATGDTDALSAHRQLQADWLNTALPDGRVPREVIEDEQDDDFLAAWDDAEKDAREILGALLTGIGDRPRPVGELHAAAAGLRQGLRGDRRGTAQLRAAGGVDPDDLPEDDGELWLTLAAGVISQRDEPPRAEFDVETLAAWSALGHAEWIAAVVLLATDGPGTELDADDLAERIVAFDFEADEEEEEEEYLVSETDEGWYDEDDGAAAVSVSLGLYPALRLWQQLGALDHEDRLTRLGWWGIPESALRAWQPSGPVEES